MKNLIIGLCFAALLGYIGFLQFGDSPSNDAPSPLSNQEIQTAVATKNSIEFVINLAGEITPIDNVSVRPEVNGQIAALPVDIGDFVNKGELLFALDDKDLQIEIESRETVVETANLRLEQAERNFERDKKLFEDNLISTDVFEDSKTNYDLALNETRRAEKELDLVEDRLTRTQVTAPFDCTVLTRSVSLGQAVSGSGGFNSGTEVMTIANLNDLMIEAHVNQVDVTRLQAGMNVNIDVEAAANLTVEGRVERIAPQATVKNGVKGFETRIVLANVDSAIQPGMTANIAIPVASASDVLATPLAAVFPEFNDETQRMERFVFRQKGSTWERVLVEIGLADYFNVEIVQGLSEGDVVALEQPDPEAVVSINAESGS